MRLIYSALIALCVYCLLPAVPCAAEWPDRTPYQDKKPAAKSTKSTKAKATSQGSAKKASGTTSKASAKPAAKTSGATNTPSASTAKSKKKAKPAKADKTAAIANATEQEQVDSARATAMANTPAAPGALLRSLEGLSPEALLAEAQLAKSTAIYIVFDMPRNRVLIKARGMILKEMPVAKARLWGPMPQVTQRPLVLAGKHAFSEPKRETIEPKTAEQQAEEERKARDVAEATGSTQDATSPAPAKFDIKALEVDDMPSSYSLHMDDGLEVFVRPGGLFMDGLWGAWRGIKDPAITLWYTMKGKSYKTMELSLSPEDARALYWAFLEGMKCIVIR